MGNYKSKTSRGRETYYLESQQIRQMKKIWKYLESDLVYYGTQFYSLLFHNHPEYFKYFQENMPHEFQADVPTMRSKFSLSCGTLAALFVEYSHKSKPREHLLEYVAMVHKDMNLTQKDMENFMTVMMEMLMKKFPHLMTADCCLSYIKYTASLTSRIHILMKELREVSCRTNSGLNQPAKKCNWLPWNNERLIYGHTAEYWERKSNHWIVQRAVWATMSNEQYSVSSRRNTKWKNSVVNFTPVLNVKNNSSSEAMCDEYNENRIRKLLKRKKRRYHQKPRNFSIQSKDDADVDDYPQTTTISNNKCAKESNRETTLCVSIVNNSSARERRRRDMKDEISIKNNPSLKTRRLTIRNEITTLENEEESFSSLNEGEEINSSGVDNKKINEKRNEPPRRTVPGDTMQQGRNVKSNKRVSISSAQWFASKKIHENNY